MYLWCSLCTLYLLVCQVGLLWVIQACCVPCLLSTVFSFHLLKGESSFIQETSCQFHLQQAQNSLVTQSHHTPHPSPNFLFSFCLVFLPWHAVLSASPSFTIPCVHLSKPVCLFPAGSREGENSSGGDGILEKEVSDPVDTELLMPSSTWSAGFRSGRIVARTLRLSLIHI